MQAFAPASKAQAEPPAKSPESAARSHETDALPAIRHDFSRIPLHPAPVAIQTKLTINTPGDQYEQEADRIAEQVMRMRAPDTDAPGTANGQSTTVVPSTPAELRATPANSGHPLDSTTRDFFEPRFGLDLSNVRIHEDSRAALSARAVAARAYTVGSHIVFGSGEYAPSTSPGRALLAHELAHVRQGALGSFPGARLSRAPCPGGCHAPPGAQSIKLESLSDDVIPYLPDANAVTYFQDLRDGAYYGSFNGGLRKWGSAVRVSNYNERSRIVGYVLHFENPLGSNFPQPVLAVDVYGKLVEKSETDRQAIQSVISPIDFIGPELLARPLIGAAEATLSALVEIGPRFAEALVRNARNLAFSVRLAGTEYLGATMRGAADFSSIAAEGGARSALVVRQGGELAAASQTARTAAEIANTRPVLAQVPTRVTGPSFADVSSDIGAEVPGTIRHGSAGAAAVAARATNLTSATRPGFQTHATAPAVRAAVGIAGQGFESAHIVPQAVYRALRARGINVSAGRALTTNLPRAAHAAFDASWVREWNAATNAGRAISAGDVYNWVSRAVNSVDDNLINAGVKGAINDRLRTELFVDLGLNASDVIIP